MPINPKAESFRPLLEAVSFSARAHHGQMRKDRVTPYSSHPFRVSLIVRHVFGFDDPAMLTAALLHDTIEDTTTDFDDIEKQFGAEVAGWVALLTKDKRLQDATREDAYRTGLAAAPWQVKVCKLADICDNLLDGPRKDTSFRLRTQRRSRYYLEKLDDPALPHQARRAFDIVAELLRDMEAEMPSAG
jgi:guanosine-3',5'-bis(diphosphate) 3'-pyrophosphohydrolase